MSDLKPVVTAWLADLIVKDKRIAELEAEIKEYEFNAHAQSKVQAADSAKIAKLKDRIAELERLNKVALEAMKYVAVEYESQVLINAVEILEGAGTFSSKGEQA